jgi:hypothetical protein
MVRTFSDKLNLALFALDEDQLSTDASLNNLATKVTGDTSATGKAKSQGAKAQAKNAAAQKKAEQLYQQYQIVKREVDKAEQDATARQDVTLFNKAASARKRMEELYKSYQMAQQQALGQGAGDPKKAAGMPPEAAAGAIMH